MITKYKVLSTKYRAFTLIELLVVISIIGILAALVTVSFTSSQRQARDTQRKSDLAQYRSSLESYANKSNSLYPGYSAGTNASSLCPKFGTDITTCPEDPKNASDSTFVYKYQSDGLNDGNANATKYVLWAKLENITSTWVVCSNGQSGAVASFTGGACPL